MIKIPYTLALELKQFGFKGRCSHYYENGKLKVHDNIFGWDFNNSFKTCCSAPSYDEFFEFARENGVHVEPQYSRTKDNEGIEWWFYIYPSYPEAGRIKFFSSEIGENMTFNEMQEVAMNEAFVYLYKNK